MSGITRDTPPLGSVFLCPDGGEREVCASWESGVVFEGGIAVPLKQLRDEYILLTVPSIAITLNDNNNGIKPND